MHGFLFQVSDQPIEENDYLEFDDAEFSYDDADYVDECDKRDEAILLLADALGGLFDYVGEGKFVYNGCMGNLIDSLKQSLIRIVNNISHENYLSAERQIHNLLNDPFNASFLFIIQTEGATNNRYVSKSSELIYTISQMQKGDCIYVGNVLDYHF